MTFVEIEECTDVIIVSLYDTGGRLANRYTIDLENYEEGSVTTMRNTDVFRAK